MKNKKEIALILAAITTTSVITGGLMNDKVKKIELKQKDIIEKYELKIKNKDVTIDEVNKNLDKVKQELEEVKEENDELKKELYSLVPLELTYYTSLPEENGGYTTTAIQTELRHGVIASNYYPIGTKILIEGTVYTVEDRGSSSFNSPNRLDVFVERKSGESNSEYAKRVYSMGKKKVKGKIISQ